MESQMEFQLKPNSVVYVPMRKMSNTSLLRPDYDNWKVSRLEATKHCNRLNEKARMGIWTVGVYRADQIPFNHRPKDTWDW